jgi:hypothetical protein
MQEYVDLNRKQHSLIIIKKAVNTILATKPLVSIFVYMAGEDQNPYNPHEMGGDDLSLPSSPLSNNVGDMPRIFHIYYKDRLYSNMSIQDSEKRPVFFVETSIVKSSKPSVTLRAGADQSAPIAAVCKFILFSSEIKVGLGDPEDLNNITWETMTIQNRFHRIYRWEMTVTTADGQSRERKSFLWKRTHSVGIENSIPSKFNFKSFKLVGEKTGELIAVFVDNGPRSLKKVGKFQLNKSYGDAWDVLIMVTGLSLFEKQRRRDG